MLIGVLFVLQSSFCQRKLDIDFSDKIVLDSLKYNGHTATRYSIVRDQVFYLVKELNRLSLYVKEKDGNTSRKVQQIEKIPRSNFLTDFLINNSLDTAFYLFNHGVAKVPLNQDVNNFSDLEYIYSLDQVNYNLDLYENKLILTGCYNYYNETDDPTRCPLSIIDKQGNEILKRQLEHDAVALTHFPSYFFSIGFGYLAFTKALSNEVLLLDLSTMNFSTIGDRKPLNDTITTIPFETKIGPESVAKKIIFETREFTKNLAKIEGVILVNDSTFCVVKKAGGRSIRSKRVIDIYRKQGENYWELVDTRKFKNKIMTKKNHLFQFHLTNKVHVVGENNWALSAMNIPKEVNSNWRMKKFGNNISFEDDIKQAVYVYKVNL